MEEVICVVAWMARTAELEGMRGVERSWSNVDVGGWAILVLLDWEEDVVDGRQLGWWR